MKANRLVLPGAIALVVALATGCLYLVMRAGAWEFLEPARIPVTPTATIRFRSPSPSVALPHVYTGTVELLEKTRIPSNDPVELSRRLAGKLPVELPLPPSQPLQAGTEQSFWVLDTEKNTYFTVQAELRYVTGHAYLWVEKGISAGDRELSWLAESFENKVYSTNREFFGSEWTPGIDGDPHLYILYVSNIGRGVGGYFSTNDEYNPGVMEYSNAHELFVLNADTERLDSNSTLGTLAHEFQHMIHWNTDRDEELWFNEGFADLAMALNGAPPGVAPTAYTLDPDIQLTSWPVDSSLRGAHYGAAYLFMSYFLDRFGEQTTRALVASPANGLSSIDQVLAASGVADPLTGRIPRADDVFADWVVATYLQDPSVAGGRYSLKIGSRAPQTGPTEEVRKCPAPAASREVSQYGVDYILIRCKGEFTLHLEGASQVPVVPVEPHSGNYAFWSNRSDAADTTLTRSFDFSGLSGPLTLSYWTWFNLEEDYDYLYLEASLDGENWEILKTPSGTGQDPSGNSYGWGYNAASGGGDHPVWIQERIDLSQYAGKRVQLRFEYVTDEGVNTEGFLLDDVEIPQAGYATDFEPDDGGWVPAGFVRIRNLLPQTFQVSLIHHGRTTTVERVALSPQNSADIPLSFSGDSGGSRQITLVISGTSRFTTEKAAYRFTILPRGAN